MNSEDLQKRIEILSQAVNDLENRFGDTVNELSLLRQAGDILGHVYDLGEASQKIVNLIYDEMAPENCSIMLYNPNINTLELFAVKSETVFESLDHHFFPVTGKRFKMGEGAAGWALKNGTIAHIYDVKRDERFTYIDDSRVKIRTLLCIPLLNQKKPEGVINLSFNKKTVIPAEKIHFLTIMMQHAGLVIGNIRLFHKLSAMNSKLKEARDNLRDTSSELHKTQKLIIQSEHNSGLEMLAGGIAHEFNNIFAAIMG